MIYFLGNENLFEDNLEFPRITQKEILEYLQTRKEIGIDIETTRKFKKNLYNEKIHRVGLDPYFSNILMLQIGDLEKQFIIDVRYIDISFLKPILESDTILKIGHNLKFETKFLFLHKDILLNNVWDTMIAERVLYNGENISYSLESLMKRHLNYKSVKDVNLFDEEEYIMEDEEEYEPFLEGLDDNKKEERDETLYIDKSIRTQFIEWGDKPFTISQIEYGASDIVTPIQLKTIQEKGRYITQFDLYNPIEGIKFECSLIKVLAKMELRGVKVDANEWLALYKKNKEIYIQKRDILDKWVIDNYPEFTISNNLFGDSSCRIDWQSSKSVIKLAKHIGFCPKEKSNSTGKLEWTVGAKSLFKLLENSNKEKFYKLEASELTVKDDVQSFILNYLIFKKYQQLTTTFGEDWLRYVNPITKRVHTNFIQLMNTGRMSSTNPNGQQIPGGEEWRKLFIPEVNNKMIATDFANQEARVTAELTQVKQLIQLFSEGHPIFGTDMHSLTATNMFRIIKNDDKFICDAKINAKERKIAKNMLFKILFGGSEFTIAQDLGVSLEEGKLFFKAFFDGYKGLEKNFTDTKNLALQRGWFEIDPLYKKRYFFPYFNRMKELEERAWTYYPHNYRSLSKEEKDIVKADLKINSPELSLIWKEFMTLKGKLERRALNFRIQGFAATMSKIAAILIDDNNRSLKFGLLLAIHDEFVEEYDLSIAEEKSLLTVEYMRDSGRKMCKLVPMDAVTAVGDYWIH